MKKALLLLSFLLVAALALPTAVQAQETLTVCDGTTTNNYIPFYGSYVDTRGCTCEFIIPAETEGMENMEGGTISKLTFYISGSPATWGNPTIQVYIGEVDGTTLSSINGPTNFTIVYSGTISNQTNPLEIEFSQAYTYNGGNLLIGTYVETASTTYKMTPFYGVSAPSGSSIYHSGSSYGSASQQSFLPKTTFEYTPGSGSTCEKPSTFEVSNVGGHSASFAWTSEVGNYTFEYKKASASDWTIVSGLSATTYTLTDLDATTAYNARVKAVCGTDSESGYKTVSFTTPCSTYDVPYTYGFEEAAPFDCWTPIAGVAIASGTSIAHNSTYYLKFSGTTSNMIALPQFTPATNPLRMEFWTRPEGYTYNNCGKFAIGYMTDINDPNTFVAIETYNYNDWTTNTYVKKTVDLVNVPAGANIAMRQFDCATNFYWYVDDITVKEMPSCEAPTALAANASANSAELSWIANSGETAWTVYYKKTTDETYTEVPDVYFNPYILEGLTAATNYQYYVVANCSAADASEPSEVFTFTTECEAISAIGYSENFDNYTAATGVLPLCWSRINTGTSYNTYPCIYGNNNNSIPNCLYFNTYGSESYTSISDQYAVLPEMSGLDGKQITLFAKGYNTSSTFKIGLMENPTDVNTFRVIATQELTTSYQEFVYQLSGEGNYVAIMMPKPTGSSTVSRGVYIDDIMIDNPPTCAKPTGLEVTTTTGTTAFLRWTDGGQEQAWQICLNGDENNLIDANTNPFVLEGLSATTAYTAKVRAYCAANDQSAWSNTVNFTTACASISSLPWSEDFENFDNNTVPQCWDNSASGSTTISGSNSQYIWGVYTSNGNKFLRMNNYSVQPGTALINSPVINMPSQGVYELTFNYAHTASCGAFTVKISEDGGTTFTDLDSYTKVGSSTSNSDPGEFTDATIFSCGIRRQVNHVAVLCQCQLWHWCYLCGQYQYPPCSHLLETYEFGILKCDKSRGYFELD